jgi:hypothetical protein
MEGDDSTGTCVLEIRVQPGARASEVVGPYGSAVKIRIAAPPVDGEANRALESFLAVVLEVPRGAVTVVSGHSSRSKRVRVTGLDAAQAETRLYKRGRSD